MDKHEHLLFDIWFSWCCFVEEITKCVGSQSSRDSAFEADKLPWWWESEWNRIVKSWAFTSAFTFDQSEQQKGKVNVWGGIKTYYWCFVCSSHRCHESRSINNLCAVFWCRRSHWRNNHRSTSVYDVIKENMYCCLSMTILIHIIKNPFQFISIDKSSEMNK